MLLSWASRTRKWHSLLLVFPFFLSLVEDPGVSTSKIALAKNQSEANVDILTGLFKKKYKNQTFSLSARFDDDF